uniref:Uncharacterized protein n=1 Tax=Pristionchus pacificus TaxID=54126 RepID=A0A2A6C4R9_PRIPA|eukprot:PDM73107.1 hypothetical protein PRIPAC_39541 [Pristionchus pacificus]
MDKSRKNVHSNGKKREELPIVWRREEKTTAFQVEEDYAPMVTRVKRFQFAIQRNSIRCTVWSRLMTELSETTIDYSDCLRRRWSVNEVYAYQSKMML